MFILTRPIIGGVSKWAKFFLHNRLPESSNGKKQSCFSWKYPNSDKC